MIRALRHPLTIPIVWAVMAVLVIGIWHEPFWNAYVEFINNNDQLAGDARQQILPYMVSNAEQDYTSRYYRDVFIPVGIDQLYEWVSQHTSIHIFSKEMGLLLLLITMLFSGLAAANLAGPWAALATMAIIISSTAIMQLTIQALPRSFALPLMAMSLWAASANRWRTMAGIILLSTLIYPVIAVIAGVWMGIASLWSSDGNWSWRPALNSRRFILLACTAVIAASIMLIPSQWGGSSYGKPITRGMLADFPEAGPEGRYRSAHDSIWGQSFIGSLTFKTYLSLAGSGKALSPISIRESLELESAFPFVCIIFLVIAGGLHCLYRSGRRQAAFLAASSFIAILLGYAISYCVMPYAFLPDRYIAYSLPVLLPVFLTCALEGIARAVAHKAPRERWLPIGMRLLLFALPILLLGGDNLRRKSGDIFLFGDVKRIHLSDTLHHAINQIPEEALVAGWPDDALDTIAYAIHRPVWVRAETHQAFHSGYTLEMRRRMFLLLDAFFSSDPAAVEKLHTEGVTHVLLPRKLYAKSSTPISYFAPFSAYIAEHWQEWQAHTPAIFNLPAGNKLFENDEYILLSLEKAPPVSGRQPLGAHPPAGTIIADASAFIHRMPRGDLLVSEQSENGAKGLFNNAAIALRSPEEVLTRIHITRNDTFHLYVHSQGKKGDGFRLSIDGVESPVTFGTGPLSLKDGGTFKLPRGEVDVRLFDIHGEPLISALALTNEPPLSESKLMTMQFPPEVKLLKSYKIPRAIGVKFGDLDGDGKMDFVVFTPDWSTYAYDHEGRELWHYDASTDPGACLRTEFEAPGSVWDFNNDGRAELVHWRWINGKDSLVIADGKTGKVVRSRAWPTPAWPHLYNNFRTALVRLSLDAPPGIVTLTDSGGTISVNAYNTKLEPLWEYRRLFEKDQLGHYIYTYDVNADGIDELYLSSLTLNANGREIWNNYSTFTSNHDHSDGLRFADLNNNKRVEVISAQSNLGLFVFSSREGKTLWHKAAWHAQSLEVGDFMDHADKPQIAISSRTYLFESDEEVDQGLLAQLFVFDPKGKLLSIWPQNPINGNPLFAKGDWRGDGKEELFWERFHVNPDGTGTLFFAEPTYQMFDFMGNGAEQVVTLHKKAGIMNIYGWADAGVQPPRRDSEYMRTKVANHVGY